MQTIMSSIGPTKSQTIAYLMHQCCYQQDRSTHSAKQWKKCPMALIQTRLRAVVTAYCMPGKPKMKYEQSIACFSEKHILPLNWIIIVGNILVMRYACFTALELMRCKMLESSLLWSQPKVQSRDIQLILTQLISFRTCNANIRIKVGEWFCENCLFSLLPQTIPSTLRIMSKTKFFNLVEFQLIYFKWFSNHCWFSKFAACKLSRDWKTLRMKNEEKKLQIIKCLRLLSINALSCLRSWQSLQNCAKLANR